MARLRYIGSDLLKNAAPVTFGLIIILGFFGVLFALLTTAFPPENKDFIASLNKTLENILIMAVGYFFGTTASSKSKDETISDIAKMPVYPAAPTAPITIPNAESVKVNPESGDVNVTPKEKI